MATFRSLAKKYPERDERQMLLDVITVDGDKGKWFAAAKDAGHLDLALLCACEGTPEPATLIRAARDFVETQTRFAAVVAHRAIDLLLRGRGYEPTPLDIVSAHGHLMAAAERVGASQWAMDEVERILASPSHAYYPALRDELIALHQGERNRRHVAEGEE